jgi:hypothetical protein
MVLIKLSKANETDRKLALATVARLGRARERGKGRKWMVVVFSISPDS